jgi:hypothetical protein
VRSSGLSAGPTFAKGVKGIRFQVVLNGGHALSARHNTQLQRTVIRHRAHDTSACRR